MNPFARAPGLDQEIKRVDLLYRQTTIAGLAVFSNIAGFTYIAWAETSHAFLITWAAILAASVIARDVGAWRWRKASKHICSSAQLNRWHLFIIGNLFISGCGWGAAAWVSLGTTPSGQQILASMLVLGMSAGALATYSPSLWAMYAVHFPSTLPWALCMLTRGNKTFFIIGLMGSMFVVLIARIAVNLNRYVVTSIRLNARLQESEERLRMARDSSSAVSWEWESYQDRFVFDGKIEQLFGVTTLGSRMEDFLQHVRAEDRARTERLFRDALTTGHLDSELRVAWPDGSEHWVAVRGRPTPTRLVGICWDITAHKNEERLRIERDVYEAANDAKLLFLANVSHEIRTPLAAINGFATKALEDGKPSTQGRRDLEAIARNGKYLVSLVSDLLDLSRSETDPIYVQSALMSPVNEVQDALQVVQGILQDKGLHAEVVAHTLLPETITSDATRFRQILINLLNNSVKYTQKGGITIHLSCADETLTVIIEDTGIGISDMVRPGLFQPFARGQSSEVLRLPGAGLGLALSQSLARRLGGDVTLLHSILGEGSKFEVRVRTGSLQNVTWRSLDELRVPAEPIKKVRSLNRLSNFKVLLVEDDPDLRELMQALLSSQGARVKTAFNGAEGVDLALGDTFDVILMDIKMPIMDGYQATSLLREHGYRGSIIALTASASAVDQQKCLLAGCDAYLSKPVDYDHLLDLIPKQIRARRPSYDCPMPS